MEEVAAVERRGDNDRGDEERPAQAFGKERRLLRRGDFVRVQGAAASSRGPHYVVLVQPRPEGAAAPARLGVVASRKVGNAVARNRGKRRVREWFRQHPRLPSGIDLVVILRAGSPSLAFGALSAELDETLRRALARRAGSRGRRRP